MGLQHPVLSVDSVIVPLKVAAREKSLQSAEADAFISLSGTVARRPKDVAQQLVVAAMRLTNAESAGLSLESVEAGELVLRWVATAGEFSRYVNGTMPRHFSPCGTAMERRTSLMMRDPQRFYPYISELHLPVRNVLLVPFAEIGKYIGTLWVVSHKPEVEFTTEDQRVVEGLTVFVAAICDSIGP